MKAFRCRDCNTQVLSYIDDATQHHMVTATSACSCSGDGADLIPHIAIPAFGEAVNEPPAFTGESHFSHFDKFSWKPVEGMQGVERKTLKMSDQCELQLMRVASDATLTLDSRSGIRMLYLISGAVRRNGAQTEAGWCGVLQANAEPVELTAMDECLLLLASYE